MLARKHAGKGDWSSALNAALEALDGAPAELMAGRFAETASMDVSAWLQGFAGQGTSTSELLDVANRLVRAGGGLGGALKDFFLAPGPRAL